MTKKDEIKKTFKKVLPTKYSFVEWKNTKKLPEHKEVQNNNVPWVSWGKDNLRPLFLNTLYEKSPSQTGIINGKVFYLTGGGYTVTPSAKTPESLAQISLFDANGVSDYSTLDVIIDVARDLELYDGFCFRGFWNPITKKPSFIEPVAFDDIRTDKRCERFFYSEDWSSHVQSLEKTGFREISAYDTNERIGEFLVYYRKKKKKTEKGRLNVYPSAPYSGCIESLATEVEMKAFHFNETQNGFKAGTVMYLPSAKPRTKRDKETISDEIKSGGTDRESAGGIIVMFGEGGNVKPEVLQLNGNDLDKRYLMTEESTAATILRAHSVTTPSLFGMLVPGQLGTNNSLKEGFEILKLTYVSARQKLINDVFTWFLKDAYDIDADFLLNPPPPILGGDSSNPLVRKINSLPDKLQDKVLESLTQNEIRSMVDAEPIEAGDGIPSPQPIFKIEKHGAVDPILKALRSAGKKRNGFVFKESNPVPDEFEEDWFETSEGEIIETIRSEAYYFDKILSKIQKDILALVDDGQDIKSISTALKKSIQEVSSAYYNLVKGGYIKKSGELSISGQKVLDSSQIPAEDFEIRYSYELRAGLPPLKGESRPFCKKLISLNRLYTRQEIETISSAVGRNVWSYRGGWFHNSQTGKNEPQCRHIWFQHLVIKKRR